jgi:hypothetical protein
MIWGHIWNRAMKLEIRKQELNFKSIQMHQQHQGTNVWQ